MNKPIIILGNGGHASVLTEILLLQNRKILGFTAPEEQINSYGLKYLGTDGIFEKYNPLEVELVLGLGTVGISNVRQSLYKKLKNQGYTFAICVHPRAIIASTATLDEGAQIMAGAIVQPHAQIGENTIINTCAIIEHDCMIGAHVHVAPGVTLSGSVHIGNGSHIGTGSTIIQGVSIGKNTIIGAGATVISNIGTNKKAFGVPAKEV
ncbi:sugar O-acyltransferase (sialic acid O-acetyltransferase NeuD family) [Lysinibacillus parviboronicapiens]|uniref:Sugar O-acyltransferase (Sialic acid O-acetyltransferase NeuD family) n=1 Tax=Lysinibacillus parviboronicapiens TaxID=436516 RepID=A0ABV2PIR6_9BACI